MSKQEEIYRSISILKYKGHAGMANRIEELQKLHLEDPEESEINQKSLNNFVNFILGHKSDGVEKPKTPIN